MSDGIFCRLTGLAAFFLFLGGALPGRDARGSEAWNRVPADAVIVLELDNPMKVFESEYLQSLWKVLSETHEVRRKLADPETDRWRSAARFLEQSLESEWRTALSKLTAGGIVLAVVPTAQESSPDVLLLVESEERDTLTMFVQSVQREVAKQRTRSTESHEYRGMTLYRTGDAYYAQVDRTLAASNSRQILTRFVDQVLAPASTESPRIPVSARFPPVAEGVSTATGRGYLSIEWLRQIREVREGLKLPSSEPGGQLLFGGYLDLLRRADVVAFELKLDDQGAEVSCRFDAGANRRPAEWNGFFADGRSSWALPPLNPKGTIYSASWFRDYHELWKSRRHWLSTDAIREIESENERQQQSGAAFGIIDLAGHLGTHYRIVVSHPEPGPEVPEPESAVWPQGALTVDLRDPPVFQERVLAPLLSLLRRTAPAFGGVVETAKEARGETSTLRLQGLPGGVLPTGLAEGVNPTVTISGNHFVIGTSRGIVLELLAELQVDAVLDEPGLPPQRDTEQQVFSFVALGRFAARHRRELERGIAQNNQEVAIDARRELDLLLEFLQQLGSMSTRGTLLPDGFEYQIQIGRRQ